jgi:putative RecB family exonuclease
MLTAPRIRPNPRQENHMSQWSHTRLETFRQCARRYFYRYVARVRLPEEPETIAQFVGKRAHEALERLYREVQRGRVPAEPELRAWFRDGWNTEWHDAVMMPDDERPPEEHRREAEGWLGDYHRRHAPFAGSRTLAVERRIAFPLDEGRRATMTGFIDRLARAPDGTWQIHDYKTNRKLPTQQEKDADPQLAYYEIGVRRMWPEAERIELTWHFLAFDTALTSRRTQEQLDALRGEALVTIADAEARPRRDDAFPTHETRLCDWCEFQSVCPVRKHRFAVGALPADRFANEPGVKLVDQWAALDERRRELKARIDAIEAEIGELKEALAAHAEHEGLEVVAGSEREATVRRNEDVVFPRKSVEADEAEALEGQLRASKWWAETSTLDRAALARLWEKRETLDRNLRALLEEFAQVETRFDVRLRKSRR